MPNKKFLPLMAAVFATLVVGCDGDDKKDQFLEPEQKVTSLVAYPQAFVLKKSQIQSVNISNSVVATNAPNWKLTSLDDKSELGTIVSQDTRSFVYSAENAGVGHINYTVNDDNLTSSSQIVLAVNDGSAVGNHPPFAQNITLETIDGANATVDLRNFISDEDGDTLQITSLISGSGRFVLDDDGYNVTFVPGTYVGIDQAVYSVDDGRGGYALAYIIANSQDSTTANTPPEAEDEAVRMDLAEQSTINIDLSDLVSDIDGDTLMVDHLYSVNNRAILAGNNKVVYTPGDFRGVDQFTYRVVDSRGANALGTITVTVVDSTVQPEEPKLMAYPQTFTVEQGDSLLVDVSQSVSSSNIDSWELTSVEDETGLGVVSDINSSSFQYLAQTPGVASLNYKVNGGGLESSSTIIVVINGAASSLNTPPVARNVELETTNEVSVSVDLYDHVSDVDGDPLVISSLISASDRFSLNDGTVVFTPNGFVGIDQASYIVEDGKGGFASAYVVVNSEDTNPLTLNTPPEARDYSYVMDVNIAPTWTLDLVDLGLISDADGDLLSIENIYTADGRAIKISDTGIRYTPGDFRGLDQFTYTVIDGNGGMAVGSIAVAVNDSTPDNAIPIAQDISITMSDTESSKTISVSDSVFDADGGPLEIVELMASIGNVRVDPSDPLAIIYEPNGFVGEDKFVYVISDSQGALAMATVTVTVAPSNATPPVAELILIETTANTAKTLDLSTYISDTETPTPELLITDVTSATLPGVATLNGQSITYTPNGYIGVDTLKYTVSDGQLTDTGDIVIISSADDNNDLIANDVSTTTDAGVAVEIDLSSQISTSDATAEPLILVSAIGASLGDVVIDDSSKKLIYTPKVGDYGTDVFVYNIKDSHEPAHFAQGIVTVDILPPSPPEITTLTIEGSPILGEILSANIVCTTCNTSQYGYDWSINGLTVSTSSTYVYQSTNPDFNVRLKVTGYDIYGQSTTEYTVYRVVTPVNIYATYRAFAALKNDGSITTWGQDINGGDSSAVDLSSGIINVSSTSRAFAALKNDGSVVTWGDRSYGGDSRAVDLSGNIKAVFSNGYAFAAIKNDGSAVTWGSSQFGGDSSGVDLSSGIISIYSSDSAFAALKNDGSVVTWGDGVSGGDSSGVDLSSGIINVYSTSSAFAALKNDGSVVTWGDRTVGGDSDLVDISSNVVEIFSTYGAFAALKTDGSVVTWGTGRFGADTNALDLSNNIKTIYSNIGAFVAKKNDGSILSWSDTEPNYGGDSNGIDLNEVKAVIPTTTSSLQDINGGAFAAIKNDGSAVTWGSSQFGGDSSGVDLSSGIISIYSSEDAFLAVKSDGSIVTWGNPRDGGDSSGVDFSSGLRNVYSNGFSFSAIKNNGQIVAWGFESYGASVSSDSQPYITFVETSIAP